MKVDKSLLKFTKVDKSSWKLMKVDESWQKLTKATIFHDIFLVKSLTFIRFCPIAMYYWHFIISYRDEWNFSVCYHTILPLDNIGKYFAIVKWKMIFPISQILKYKALRSNTRLILQCPSVTNVLACYSWWLE